MGNPNPPPGRPFQKGWAGGPGWKAVAPELRELKKSLPNQLAIAAKEVLFKDAQTVEKMGQDKTLPLLVWVIARNVFAAGKNADPANFEWLLTRLLGKPKEYDFDADDQDYSDPTRLSAMRNLIKIGLGLIDGHHIDTVPTSPVTPAVSGLLGGNEIQTRSDVSSIGQTGISDPKLS